MGFFSLGDALEFRILCVLMAGWKNHLRLMILEGGLQGKYETSSEKQVK